MKLEQSKNFKPITLTMETRVEAETFWNLINAVSTHNVSQEMIYMKDTITKWFTNKAHL
jgi:hypothetical protein